MDLIDFHKLYVNSSGICTDTRKIKFNCVFFALKGERFDGNALAAEAITLGAKYAVIDNPVYCSENTILVADVLAYLQSYANYYRNTLLAPIFALTGSNGKTTTKELIHAVLSSTYYTIATIGNLNNHIGVPLTLLSFDESMRYGIVEMGANHQLEIAKLCEIAQPDAGLITNVGLAHLEGFGGLDGVKRGKGEMYDYLYNHHKKILVNSDDTILCEMLAERRIENALQYGSNDNAEVIGTLINDTEYITIKYEDIIIYTQMYGSYNFSNFMAAIAVGKLYGISNQLIKKGLENYIPSNQRSQRIIWNNNIIILDAYNANPSSMQIAIENFAHINSENKIVILGDMYELGAESLQEHVRILQLALSYKFKQLVLVGTHFGEFNQYTSAVFIPNIIEASKWWSEQSFKNSYILIKGSRGIELEKMLTNIL